MRNPKTKNSADMALSMNLVSAKDLEDMMAFLRSFKLKYQQKKAAKTMARPRKN